MDMLHPDGKQPKSIHAISVKVTTANISREKRKSKATIMKLNFSDLYNYTFATCI